MGDNQRGNLSWLLGVSKPMAGGLLLGLVLVACKTIASIALTGVQKWIIDDVFLQSRYEKLWPILIVFALAIIVYNTFHALGDLTLTRSTHRLHRALTERLIRTVHRWPAGRLQQERTGALVHHVTGDIQSVSGIYSGLISTGLQHIVAAVTLIVVIGYASPVMLAVTLAVGALYIPLGKHFGPRLKAVSKQVQERRSELVVHLEEGIASTREVVAFDRTDWEFKRYRNRFSAYFEQVMKEGKLMNRQMLSSDPLSWAVRLLILGYGGLEVMRGNLTVGLFVIVYQFSTQLMDAVYGIYQSVTGAAGRMASIERVRRVLEQEQLAEGSKRLAGPLRTVTFRQVDFRYAADAPFVLKQLSFELPLGGKAAFVGGSGGGKSTIAQLLIRFQEPTSGRVEADGAPLSDISRTDWTERVAVVFQEPYLFPDTIRSNLLLNDDHGKEEQMREACRIACIDDWIADLPDGYDTVLGERGITLSGGQRQRIALARAVLRHPEILILDEATSALDLETERRVMERLDRARQGKTTIVIAHRLSTVQNAELIYVVDQGRIAEQGTHEQLMEAGGVYVTLVRAQTEQERERGA